MIDDYNVIARRVLVHQSCDGFLPAVTAMLDSTSCPSQTDGRRLSLLVEAVGDLSAALTHGHTNIDGELHLVQAMCQLWAEDLERRRAL